MNKHFIFILGAILMYSCGGKQNSIAQTNQQETNTPSHKTGTMTDPRDGLVYKTLILPDGTTWMAENLVYFESDSTNQDNGMIVFNQEGYKKWANINPNENRELGIYYSFEAVQKACPEGWRVPTAEDWWALTSYFTNSGMNIREGWGPPLYAYPLEQGGFNIKLAGRTRNTDRIELNEAAYYWSSTEEDNFTGAYGTGDVIPSIKAICFNWITMQAHGMQVILSKRYLRMPCRCVTNNHDSKN